MARSGDVPQTFDVVVALIREARQRALRNPGMRGFSPQNLWRMRQFFEARRDKPKVSTLLRELPWSAGLLLCATKDNEVVEYALSRAMSPTLVAEYRTRLPERRLLEANLHEFYQQAIEEHRGLTPPAKKDPGTAQAARRKARPAKGRRKPAGAKPRRP